ncbi:hypothetical protein DUI87_08776 [Hirundo rustica rustica]|uniref:Uncharacterized protein n=1 Tax=Hirundo rustica rustica TaxID=333673 RepID=A0A3M0KKB9_HIRRU|nr:hypothetical protein DUI87_08776 [Hirundo rustica rustica]
MKEDGSEWSYWTKALNAYDTFKYAGTIFLPGNRVIEHPCNEESPGKFLFEVVPVLATHGKKTCCFIDGIFCRDAEGWKQNLNENGGHAVTLSGLEPLLFSCSFVVSGQIYQGLFWKLILPVVCGQKQFTHTSKDIKICMHWNAKDD